jgi:tRNA threonylcarbamoyladenosine biosynthesis protein TsaB
MILSPPAAPALSGAVLVIEAATAAGSVAVLQRADAELPWSLLATTDVPMGSGREDRLTPAVSAVCETARVPLSALAAVVCGSGPGSFTSLRIASALAKGLAFGLERPLYAVPSLLLAAATNTDTPPASGSVLVLLDALRDECFAQRAHVGTDGFARCEGPLARVPRAEIGALAGDARVLEIDASRGVSPQAGAARWCAPWEAFGPLSVDTWEPEYGRLAEAQVKWEEAHGRALPAT